MTRIEKSVYEEPFRYHQFKRADGRGWLNELETVSTCTVTITEKATGDDVSSTMVANVAAYASTCVRYQLLGGVAGRVYTIDIRCVTSNTQKFEDKIELKVI